MLWKRYDLAYKVSNLFHTLQLSPLWKVAKAAKSRFVFFLMWSSAVLTWASYRDTVNSVGLIPCHLPFTTSNTIVKMFRHTLALDERQAKFKANQWNWPMPTEQMLSITDKSPSQLMVKHKQKSPTSNGKYSLRDLETRYSKDKAAPTDIDKVSSSLSWN
jgi:uncharacterized protein (DUF2235 family)